jgi:hypothetical protein
MIIEIGKTDKPKRGTELASCGLSSFITKGFHAYDKDSGSTETELVEEVKAR